MSTYLETIYFRDEYSEEAYPQKLCNHLATSYLSKLGDLKGKKLLDIGSERAITW